MSSPDRSAARGPGSLRCRLVRAVLRRWAAPVGQTPASSSPPASDVAAKLESYNALQRSLQLELKRLDEAEQWYHKALEIHERLNLGHGAADDYHQLGRIAEERMLPTEAEQWYRKALEFHERLKLDHEAATDCYQLGIVAQQRSQVVEAAQWYYKALEIYQRLDLHLDAADVCHQLGSVAAQRHNFPLATKLFQLAESFYADIGDTERLAVTKRSLAQLQGPKPPGSGA
jgi:tetratricopeptide (TPR) repeat protein